MTKLFVRLLVACALITSAHAQAPFSIDSVRDSVTHKIITATQPVSLADSTGAASTGLDSSIVAGQTGDGITGQAGILMKDGQPLYPLSPERRELLSEHAKTVNTWRFIELFSGLLVVAIILFTGLSAKLRNWAKAFRNSYLMIWFYTVLVLVVMSILSFPLDYYRDYHLEVTYGFMN